MNVALLRRLSMLSVRRLLLLVVVAALLSTHARLMGLAGRWVAFEGLSGRPDADP